jgi:hypothetical protein
LLSLFVRGAFAVDLQHRARSRAADHQMVAMHHLGAPAAWHALHTNTKSLARNLAP